MQLKDKVVVVTGGAHGIGQALCRRFAVEGARGVVVADCDGAAAEMVASAIGGLAVAVDVGVEADLVRLVKTATDAYGAVDLFCSNAGIITLGGVETPDADWQHIWEVNVLAHVWAARAVLPGMLARGHGYLLQTASAAGLLTQIGSAPYAVTKHAAVALAEWLAITYADRGIKVSCLCPMGVRTRMLEGTAPGGIGDLLKYTAVEPEVVAEAVMQGLADERFLILPHPEVAEYIRHKAGDYERWLRTMERFQQKLERNRQEVVMTSQVDQAVPIRAGEELPMDSLEAYLKQHLPTASGPLTVEQFAHGHSNLTYLLRLGSTELVLRRPPFGNQVKTAHDMGREYRVLSALSPLYAPAPRPLLYCVDEAVLGAPFYIMERRHGAILRQHLPTSLVLDPPTARKLSLAFIDNLALLHSLDCTAPGFADLGKPEGYVARQVHGWIKRFTEAKTDELPALDRTARWLADNLPADTDAALIHNDYKYDNLLLDPDDLTRIVAVLDWEMATVGSPLMDLGTTLGYWVEETDPPSFRQVAAGPTYLPGSLTRQELIERYQEKTGRPLVNALFYYCYGLFKIAGIVQQIYARYVRGKTRDPRFARLNEWVAVLGRQAERAQETGKI